jgi:hypothetical protein
MTAEFSAQSADAPSRQDLRVIETSPSTVLAVCWGITRLWTKDAAGTPMDTGGKECLANFRGEIFKVASKVRLRESERGLLGAGGAIVRSK